MDKSVEYRGGQIHYTTSGAGEIIVLLHGYLESLSVWRDFELMLSHKFRVIAIDFPGNGDSSLYDDDHTMCFLADGVMRVLDNENVTQMIVLGHSLGGYVALNIVDRYPERVKGYILFHSHPFADTDAVKENRLREIEIVNSGKKELIYPVNIPRMFADSNLEKFSSQVEKLKQIASFHEGAGIVSIVKGMMNRKSRVNILEEGGVPLLLILGRKDNYINCEMITGGLILPANASLEILEESGHMGFIEEADRSLDLVLTFCESVLSRNN